MELSAQGGEDLGLPLGSDAVPVPGFGHLSAFGAHLRAQRGIAEERADVLEKFIVGEGDKAVLVLDDAGGFEEAHDDDGQAAGSSLLRDLGDTFGVGGQDEDGRAAEFIGERIGRDGAREVEVGEIFLLSFSDERWQALAAAEPDEVGVFVLRSGAEEGGDILRGFDGATTDDAAARRFLASFGMKDAGLEAEGQTRQLVSVEQFADAGEEWAEGDDVVGSLVERADARDSGIGAGL